MANILYIRFLLSKQSLENELLNQFVSSNEARENSNNIIKLFPEGVLIFNSSTFQL